QLLVVQGELGLHLIIDRPRDAEAAGLGQALQPRRNIDSIAVDALALDDDISQVDADTKLHTALHGQRGVPGFELVLDGDGALYRFDHAGKLRQQVVPWGVHDAPPVLLDESGHHLAIRRYSTHGCRLILAHEAAIPLDICAEDRRKLAFHAPTLPELRVACLPDPEVGRTTERVAQWCDNRNEVLLCGCAPYPSCSRSRTLMIDRHRAC